MDGSGLILVLSSLNATLGTVGNITLLVNTQLPEVLSAIGDSRLDAARLSHWDIAAARKPEDELERVLTELKGAYAAYDRAASTKSVGTLTLDLLNHLSLRSGARRIKNYRLAAATAAAIAVAYHHKGEPELARRWHQNAEAAFTGYSEALLSASDAYGGYEKSMGSGHSIVSEEPEVAARMVREGREQLAELAKSMGTR